jgi:integrase/recombinase XerD
MNIGLGGDRGVPAMAAEISEWIAFMTATGASPATIKVRCQTLQTLVRQSGYSSPVDLTRRDVLRFLSRDLKPWTRWTYFRCIIAWDRWAREFDYTVDSIVRGIPSPRKPAPVARPLTDEQIRALLAAPLPRRARAYILLALYEGLRVHEIAKLRGEHLDHSAGWLIVHGKGNVVAHVPIHSEISSLAASFPKTGYWFCSNLDPQRHVEPISVSATVKHAMLSIGVDATAHRLRDTAATRLQREVHDLRLTQAFLRHASVATTQKYVAISDAALQAAAQTIRWTAA